MKYRLIFIFFFYIISSCDNQPTSLKEQPQENFPLEKDQNSVREALSSDLSPWTEHWANYIPDFSEDKFKKVQESELQDLSSDLIPEMQPGREFQEKMIKSPDNSRYLDLYSYKIIIFSKNGVLRGSINPDSEAVIIDEEQEIRNRVLFMGPAGGIEDASWLADDEILISGFSVDESDKTSPMLWHIDLNKMKIISYTYPASTDYPSKAYLEKVFPQVQFD